MAKRDSYIDGIKFLLIILVISVHALESNPTPGTSELAIYHFEVSFLMPFFIMLSGLFFRNLDIRKIRKSSLKILESYLVFQFIHIAFNIFLYRKLPGIIDVIIYQEWTLWFLISLISWKFMLYYAVKLIKNKTVILIGSVILSLTIGFLNVDGDVFSIYRTIGHFPFFLIGYLMNLDRVVRIYSHKNYLYILLPVLFLGIFFLPFVENYEFFRYILYRNYPYASTPAPNYLDFAVNVFSYVAGLTVSFSILKFFPSVKIFEKLGVQTLFFYLYHPVVLRILDPILFSENKLGYEPTPWMLFVIFALTVGVVYIFSRFKFFHLMLNPVSRSREIIGLFGKKKQTAGMTKKHSPPLI